MSDGRPGYRSHYLPRTPHGRRAVMAFLAVFALCQPPVVHGLMNRVTPLVGGLPFLYVWLLGVYTVLVAILIWALRRGV